jgi:hypothetical protein
MAPKNKKKKKIEDDIWDEEESPDDSWDSYESDEDAPRGDYY